MGNGSDPSQEDQSSSEEPGSQSQVDYWTRPSRSETVNDRSDSASDSDTTNSGGGRLLQQPITINHNGETHEVTNARDLQDIYPYEFSDDYPIDANYICDICNDFSTHRLYKLKAHIISSEEVSWDEYVVDQHLHWCVSCGDPIPIGHYYCEKDGCTHQPEHRIPCLNCGRERVNADDPFCSVECATERLKFGELFEPPTEPTDDWIDHPHRVAEGIPMAAPYIESGRYTCRECYSFRQDNLQRFAVHVVQGHDIAWSQYIQSYELRTCRVCDTPLRSLLPRYCSDKCQQSDPDPILVCQNADCDTPVERRQLYCSRSCFAEHASVVSEN